MIDLSINPEQTIKTLTNFINETLKDAGFNRVVLGLSGGLDSAVSLYLGAKALGADNILAIRMPYKTSPAHSLTDAQLMIDALGVQSMTVNITPIAEPLINLFEGMNKTRAGNIMARMRMVVLFDQSVAFNGLVMGASNKSELLLGYTTVFGDSAVAFQPIGDLYKTQVRQLAKHLGVPSQIINKTPSADLWEGQTDEGDLGFTYEEVDQLLYLLIDQHLHPETCIEMGFNRSFVEIVIKKIRQNSFKRVMPPIAKLSKGTDVDIDLYFAGWGK